MAGAHDGSNGGTMPELTRRRLLGAAGAAGLAWLLPGCSGGGTLVPPAGDTAPASDAALLDDLGQRSFRFFWETSDPATGLAQDRWPTPAFASVAAVGFGLSGIVIGAERGWVSREDAAERVRTTLRFFHEAPQGPAARGMTGHRGFFYHFLEMGSGTRFGEVELSTLDTALFLAGALHCARWFDRDTPAEATIRTLAAAIYERVDWRWAQPRGPAICQGWKPETGFLDSDYKGYDEAMVLYLLALGAPTRAVDASAWDAWCSTYDGVWGTDNGQTYLRYPSLFIHQFSHAWVDFRGPQDAYMRRKELDYFENSRRATLAQIAYARTNPEGWAGYGGDFWGITACDGPLDITLPFGGRERRFISYSGRGIGGGLRNYDDGTIAPYAAVSSLPFTPEASLAALRAFRGTLGDAIFGRYGFFAYNRSFTAEGLKLTHGKVVPGFGWVDTDYLGIEVGPLLMMVENFRSGTVWRTMRGEPHLRRGLERAGFRGGWLG